MAELDFSAYRDEGLRLKNVPSRNHPTGKTYVVPAVSFRDGLALERLLASSDGKPLSMANPEVVADYEAFCGRDADGGIVPFSQRLLGPVYDEMIADGITDETLTYVGGTVYLSFAAGNEVAQRTLTLQAARAAGDAAAGEAEPPTGAAPAVPSTTRRTGRKTAGSGPGTASGRTPAPNRTSSLASTRSSGRSSTSPKPRGTAAGRQQRAS